MTHSFDPIQTCKATATKIVQTTKSLSAGSNSETDDVPSTHRHLEVTAVVVPAISVIFETIPDVTAIPFITAKLPDLISRSGVRHHRRCT